MVKKILRVAAIVLAVALLLTGAAAGYSLWYGHKNFVGKDAAVAAAMAEAGVERAQLLSSKAHVEAEDGLFVYEVTLRTAARKYEYEVHAATGTVLHEEHERWERDD